MTNECPLEVGPMLERTGQFNTLKRNGAERVAGCSDSLQESIARLGLVELLGWDLTPDDFTEEAVVGKVGHLDRS